MSRNMPHRRRQGKAMQDCRRAKEQCAAAQRQACRRLWGVRSIIGVFSVAVRISLPCLGVISCSVPTTTTPLPYLYNNHNNSLPGLAVPCFLLALRLRLGFSSIGISMCRFSSAASIV